MNKPELELESNRQEASPKKLFSFSLLSAFLVITVAALWISYFQTSTKLLVKQNQLAKLKRSVGKLVVSDLQSYEVVLAPPMFVDDKRFEIYLPPRDAISTDPDAQPYRLCMASEMISDDGSLAPPNALQHPLSPGRHEIRFVFDNELGEFAKLYLDGEELLDLAKTHPESVFMQDQHVPRPTAENKDWLLFCGIDLMSDQFFETRKGPGGLLWIDKDPK